MATIIIEGALHCPPREVRKLIASIGYNSILTSNYEACKRRGIFNHCTKDIAAIIIGPKPHNIKNGCAHFPKEKDGIPTFVCRNFNGKMKITKAALVQTLAKILVLQST